MRKHNKKIHNFQDDYKEICDDDEPPAPHALTFGDAHTEKENMDGKNDEKEDKKDKMDEEPGQVEESESEVGASGITIEVKE